MLQEHDDRLRIIRARTILDMLGERPATGRDLFRPLKGLDNAALLVRGGRVLDVLPWKSVRVPVGTPVTDMGDVALMPGSVNAHCHLQLSHTAGRTLFGAGFTAWLRSLIALLREEHDGTALIGACRDMAAAGTAHVGDYAGDGLLAVDAAVRAEGMGVTHFCEWFGGQAPFIDDGRPWPPRCPCPAGTPAGSGRTLCPGRARPVFHGCPRAAGCAAVVPSEGASLRPASGGIRGRDAPAA